MKIAVTICDFGAAANIGADTERTTYLIDLPHNLIPLGVSKYFADLEHCKAVKQHCWQTISLSLAEEHPHPSQGEKEQG